MKSLLYLLTLLFLCSCEERTSDNKDSVSIRRQPDSVVWDVPDYFRHRLIYNPKEVITNLLKLDPLTSGASEFEMRIWFYYPFQDTQQLVILKQVKENWTALFYNFILSHDNDGFIDGVEKVVIEKKPISGWDAFTDSLFSIGIDKVKDHTAFPVSEYRDPTHGSSITVEVAKPGLYKMNSYPAFDSNKEKFEDLQKFDKALTLIEKEFHWKRAVEDESDW